MMMFRLGCALALVAGFASGAQAQTVTYGPVPLAARLVSTQTAAASATLDFVLPGGHNTYLLDCNGLLPADNLANLWLRYGQGAGPTYLAAGYAYTISVQYSTTPGVTTLESASAAQILVALAAWNSLPNSITAKVWFTAVPAAGTRYVDFSSATVQGGGAGLQKSQGAGGYTTDTTAITALRVMPSSATLTEGQCSLYAMVP